MFPSFLLILFIFSRLALSTFLSTGHQCMVRIFGSFVIYDVVGGFSMRKSIKLLAFIGELVRELARSAAMIVWRVGVRATCKLRGDKTLKESKQSIKTKYNSKS